MLEQLLRSLASLPPVALYAALAAAAAIENIFPPFPADTVVAFGSLLAARGSGTALGAFLATWAGNVSGAMGTYWLGRRYGSAALERRLARRGGAAAAHRLEALYARRGLTALFLSRFLPAVRALVPPFGGAARVRAPVMFAIIGGASAVWYGLISVIAFHAGANWDAVRALVSRLGIVLEVGAAALLIAALVWWLVRRRRARIHSNGPRS